MALYRYQVVAVGMWRGKIKRWNTRFYSANLGLEGSFRDIVSKSSYANPGDAAGACSGGVASVTCYPATGGAPINVATYFDWQTPSTWIPFSSTVWTGTPEDTAIDASGESALVVTGLMANLSSTGKPVYTRRYLHAVPSRTAASFTAPDIDATSLAAIEALWTTGYLRNPAGIEPESVVVEPYYGNHQRVRGRRRTTSQVATQSFSAGVVAGTSVTAGGAGGRELVR